MNISFNIVFYCLFIFLMRFLLPIPTVISRVYPSLRNAYRSTVQVEVYYITHVYCIIICVGERRLPTRQFRRHDDQRTRAQVAAIGNKDKYSSSSLRSDVNATAAVNLPVAVLPAVILIRRLQRRRGRRRKQQNYSNLIIILLCHQVDRYV